MLNYVQNCINSENAKGFQGNFHNAEVYYSLCRLQNDKTLGIDGIMKEFILAFWDGFFDMILDIIYDDWNTNKLDSI